MATTNLADRVISGVQALMNQITSEKGMAEGGATQCPNCCSSVRRRLEKK